MKSKGNPILTWLFVLCTSVLSAQDYRNSDNIPKSKIKPVFIQYEISTPLVENLYRGEIYTDGYVDTNWFVPDGLAAKIGVGVQKNRFIGISAHTGLDWRISPKIVAVPLYGNLRLSLGVGNDKRITLQGGFGKGFVLGRSNLVGDYKRLSIGYETEDDIILFAEISGYEFGNLSKYSVGNFCLGVALRTF